MAAAPDRRASLFLTRFVNLFTVKCITSWHLRQRKVRGAMSAKRILVVDDDRDLVTSIEAFWELAASS